MQLGKSNSQSSSYNVARLPTNLSLSTSIAFASGKLSITIDRLVGLGLYVAVLISDDMVVSPGDLMDRVQQ